MARKLILKEDGLNGTPNSPVGYRFIGYDNTTASQKVGATVSSIGGSSSSGAYITSQVSITPSEIISMNTSPVELILSPGVGKLIIVEKVVVGMDGNGATSSYSGVEDYGLVVTYGNNPSQTLGDPASIFASILVSSGTLSQPVVYTYSPYLSDMSSTAFALQDNIFFNLSPVDGILGNNPPLLFPNLGIYLTTNGSVDIEEGNVPINIYLTYRIITL